MKKEDKFEIRSSNYPYDFSSWCIEKSNNVVKNLAYIVEYIKNNEYYSSTNNKDSLQYYLSDACHDATKLLAFSCGQELSSEDYGLIFQKGMAGYEEVANKFNILHDTEAKRRIRIITRQKDILNQILKCLEGSRSQNRTLIHDLLLQIKTKNPIFTEICYLTEMVTNGEISWQEYVGHAKQKIDKLLELNSFPI